MKYVHQDGREAVFDGDTFEPITESKYMATYNFGSYMPLPNDPTLYDYVEYACNATDHFFWDMIPYYLTLKSNTREDFENKVVSAYHAAKDIVKSAINRIADWLKI